MPLNSGTASAIDNLKPIAQNQRAHSLAAYSANLNDKDISLKASLLRPTLSGQLTMR